MILEELKKECPCSERRFCLFEKEGISHNLIIPMHPIGLMRFTSDLTSDGVMTSGLVPGEGPGAVISPRPDNCDRGNQIRMQDTRQALLTLSIITTWQKWTYLPLHASRLFIIMASVEVQRETSEKVARICVLVLKFT